MRFQSIEERAAQATIMKAARNCESVKRDEGKNNMGKNQVFNPNLCSSYEYVPDGEPHSSLASRSCMSKEVMDRFNGKEGFLRKKLRVLVCTGE